MLLYATPRFAFLSVKIIRRELSGRHDDHGIIAGPAFFMQVTVANSGITHTG